VRGGPWLIRRPKPAGHPVKALPELRSGITAEPGQPSRRRHARHPWADLILT